MALSYGILTAIVLFTVNFSIYGFGIKDTFLIYDTKAVGRVPGDRIVITLIPQTIREINIDKTLSRVEIWADEIRSVYYDRFSDGVKMTRADGKYKAGSFVAFDYFEPGLIKYIEANLSQYYITVSAEDRPWTHEKQKRFLSD